MSSEEILRAFISSSIEEFGAVRAEIASRLTAHLVEPVYWEKLGKPSGISPVDFYLRYLGTCQLYIGILGERESDPTEKEYEEAVLSGLERWIFIKEISVRSEQITTFIQRVEREVVRETFADDIDLAAKVEARIQSFVSQTTREYLELRKHRTHEFLLDYRRQFLEPLLIKLQLNRDQLEKKQTVGALNYGEFEKHPYFPLDSELESVLGNFFEAIGKAVEHQTLARSAYQKNCGIVTKSHLTKSLIAKFPSLEKEISTACQIVDLSLSQWESPFLYTRTSDINEYQSILGSRTEAEATIRKEMDALDQRTGQKIVGSLPANYAADVLRHLMELNQEEIDIDKCLKARQAAAEEIVKAYSRLWATFVKSTGYSS
jgi:uncharacterized protein (UPF0335 family)